MTYEEVTDTITFLVEHTGICKVDKDGLVYYKGNKNDDTLVKVGGMLNGVRSETNLVVFKETIPHSLNATILNPFAEGMAKTEAQEWFYTLLQTSFTMKLVLYIKYIVSIAAEQKKEDAPEIPSDLMEIISPYVSKADNKVLKDLEPVFEKKLDFFSTQYLIKEKKAKARFGIFGESSVGYKEQFKHVRPKTWKLLTDIICDLFELDKKAADKDKMNKYKCSMKSRRYPRLSSTLELYGMLYENTNSKFETLENYLNGELEYPMSVDLDAYIATTDKGHLDDCHEIAKNVSSSRPSTDTVSSGSRVPATNSTPQQERRRGVPSPFHTPGIGGSRIPDPTGNSSKRIPMPGETSNRGIPLPDNSVSHSGLFGDNRLSGSFGASGSLFDGGPVEQAGSVTSKRTYVFNV